MVIAYIDNGHISDADTVRGICAELGAKPVTDFDMVPLYGGGGDRNEIGRECRSCGAPLGLVDPEECRYVMLGTCSDCRE